MLVLAGAVVMKKNKKHYIAWTIFLVWGSGIITGLTGCGANEEGTGGLQDVMVPSFQYLLEEEEESPTTVPDSSAVVPVRIYFDNTGSMEGFTIDQKGERKPCSLYAKLMRCLRDMGRMQTVEYYVLDVNEQDWALYEESLYDNFYSSDFHVWWKSGQPGPLSKLYMDDRIDEEYINIVLTDLAEQNLNNTLLAEQIQKLCNEKDCEADLFAFKFDFNGVTQVPDPNAASGMLEETVHGEKPYYMLITGKSDYMEKYRRELRTLMDDAGMEEGRDYFWATNRTDIQNESLTMSDVVFEPFADYEQIFQEREEKRQKQREEEEGGAEDEETGNGLAAYSKNLCRLEDTEQICAGIDFAAFYYQKVEGVSKDQSDWRLNFYVPLKDYENPQLKYSYEWHIYKLEQAEPEEEEDLAGKEGSGEEQKAEAETIAGNWVEDTNARIELSTEIYENFGEDQEHSAVLYLSCKDKEVEKEHEPRAQELLLLIDITKEETFFYERPDWLAGFDTGDTDDYFTRTFNLNGFYDVLFGNKNKISGDGAIHIESHYVQIPIMLFGLKE